MRKALLLGMLLCGSLAWAQGGALDHVLVVNRDGRPVPGATVRICTKDATGVTAGDGVSCSPLASAYTDAALSAAATNPVTADSRGNVKGIFLPPGRYWLEISGTGLTTYEYQVTVSPDHDALNIRYACEFFGATLGAKIVAAHTDLPSTGGVIDARCAEAAQTASAITFTKPVELIIGGSTLTADSITFNAAGKITCMGHASELKAALTTGDLLTWNYAVGAEGLTYPDSGIYGCTVTGPNSGTGNAIKTGGASGAAFLNIERVRIDKFGGAVIARGANAWNLRVSHSILNARDGAKIFDHPSGSTLSGENNSFEHTVFRSYGVYKSDGVNLEGAAGFTCDTCSFINTGVKASGTSIGVKVDKSHWENADYAMGAGGTFFDCAAGVTAHIQLPTFLHTNLGTAPTSLIKTNGCNLTLGSVDSNSGGGGVTNLVSADGAGEVNINGVMRLGSITNLYTLQGTWTGSLCVDLNCTVTNNFFHQQDGSRVFVNATSGALHALSIRNREPTATRRWDLEQRTSGNGYSLRLWGFDGTNSPNIFEAKFSGASGLYTLIAPVEVGSGTFATAESMRFPNAGLMAWRNAANSANLTAGYNGSDVYAISGSASIGGGTAITTSNQTGTGSIVLATSPTLVTPALGAATATSINLGGATVTDILTGTASLDFTALAANTCEVLTITVTGAADGDAVTGLGIPTALADVDGATERTTFLGWVSGADTVSVRRCNVTGTITADPAAATVRAVVTKF